MGSDLILLSFPPGGLRTDPSSGFPNQQTPDQEGSASWEAALLMGSVGFRAGKSQESTWFWVIHQLGLPVLQGRGCHKTEGVGADAQSTVLLRGVYLCVTGYLEFRGVCVRPPSSLFAFRGKYTQGVFSGPLGHPCLSLSNHHSVSSPSVLIIPSPSTALSSSSPPSHES